MTWTLHFAERPAKLFTGAEKRLTSARVVAPIRPGAPTAARSLVHPAPVRTATRPTAPGWVGLSRCRRWEPADVRDRFRARRRLPPPLGPRPPPPRGGTGRIRIPAGWRQRHPCPWALRVPRAGGGAGPHDPAGARWRSARSTSHLIGAVTNRASTRRSSTAAAACHRALTTASTSHAKCMTISGTMVRNRRYSHTNVGAHTRRPSWTRTRPPETCRMVDSSEVACYTSATP